uniref:ORF75a n=1 Tax=Pinus koraiensis TaxID=88728 RepID=A4QM38_PINKO|nr:ORF75a [Pinus koraiensis]ABP35367.1 ORF75a [Pinus koraiensis]
MKKHFELEPNFFLFIYEEDRKAEIVHSEHLLRDYVKRSDQINHDQINAQSPENLQSLSDLMSVRLLFYLQMQCTL